MNKENKVRQLLVGIDVEAKRLAEYCLSRLPANASNWNNILDFMDTEGDPEKQRMFQRLQNRIRQGMPTADPFVLGFMVGSMTIGYMVELRQAQQNIPPIKLNES